VAVTNVVTGVVNLGLSVLLVRPFGLVGVALGTLIPVGLAAVLVVFPAGCRHVELSPRRVWSEAIWPSTWPALVMAFYIWLTRDLVADSLVAIGAEMLVGVALYGAIFLFFAVSRAERRLYLSKANELAATVRITARPVPEGA